MHLASNLFPRKYMGLVSSKQGPFIRAASRTIPIQSLYSSSTQTSSDVRTGGGLTSPTTPLVASVRVMCLITAHGHCSDPHCCRVVAVRISGELVPAHSPRRADSFHSQHRWPPDDSGLPRSQGGTGRAPPPGTGNPAAGPCALTSAGYTSGTNLSV